MSITSVRPNDQSVKIMQQQIANLESELASMRQSLNAVHLFSQSLTSKLAVGGHVPSLAKMSTGNGGFKLEFRP